MVSTPPILWDVYEEHLDEAEFLWIQWERAFESTCTVMEIATGLEERLLVHLEALAIGGAPVCERVVLPALEADEPARVAVAAWVVLHADHADLSEVVWQRLLVTEEAQRRAISRALELSQRSDVVSRWMPRLGEQEPRVQALLIDAALALAPSTLAGLSLWRHGAAAPPAEAALLRAGEHGLAPALRPLFERGLAAEDDELRASAIEAAALLRTSCASACRAVISERSPSLRLALAALALQADTRDVERLTAWSLEGELQREALWALAFTGRVDVATHLLRRLDDPAVAASAAEAFGAITGLVIDGEFSVLQQGDATPSVGEDDADAPLPELRTDDDLAAPEPEAVRRWWTVHAQRFDPAVRYVYGERWSEASLLTALAAAPAWRRPGLRLALGSAGAPINLRTWARSQVGGGNDIAPSSAESDHGRRPDVSRLGA